MGKDFNQKVSIAFLAIALILPLFYFSFLPWGGGDSVHYLLLAKSIAHRHAYLDIYLPEEPPHTQYPPGWPLSLSPFALIFRNPLLPAKFLLVILSFVTIFLGFKFFKRLKDPWLQLGSFIMLFTTLSYVQYSTFALSDLPFLLVVMIYIGLIQKRPKDISASKYRIPLLLSVFGFYIRTIGISLLLGHIFYMWFIKNKRALWEAVLIGIPLVLLWPIRNLLLTGSAGNKSGYLSSFLLKNPTVPDLGKATIADLLLRPFQNLYIFTRKSLPEFFLASHSLNTSILGIFLVFFLLLGIINLKKRKSLHTFLPFFIFYFPIYLMWPLQWNERRFLLPIAPFLVVLILDGSRFIFFPFKRFMRSFPLVIALIFAFLNVFYMFQNSAILWERNKAFIKNEYSKISDPGWAAFLEAAQWLRENSDKDAVIFVKKPRILSYFSERHCKSYAWTLDKEKMWSSFEQYRERPEYLVYTSWISGDKYFLRRFLSDQENMRYLSAFFESTNKKLIILKFVSFPGFEK